MRSLWSRRRSRAASRGGSRAARRTRRRPGRRTARRSRSFARPDGPPQLWLLPADGGEPEQLTTLPLGAGAPVWSPDGSRIAFARGDRSLARRRGRARRAPIVADRLDYQADGAGYLRTIRKHLHVLDLATKECRQVTRGDWHAGDPAWSPDGGDARVRGRDRGRRRPALPRAALHVVDAASPTAEPRARRSRRRASPAPSPGRADGSALLVVGLAGRAGRPRRPAARAARRRRADRPRGAARPQRHAGRPGLPGRPAAVRRRRRTVLFCVRDRGCTHLYAVAARRRRRRACSSAATARVVAALSVAGGTAAIVLATPTSFGEIVVVDLATGAETVAHRARRDARGASSSSRARSASSRSRDGTVVQGWLVRDPDAAGAVAAAARHPRRAAQRLERRRRRRAPLPPGARGARLDGAAAQPARQRRLRRGLLRRRARRLGRGRREGLPRADRRARRRGRRRPGAARRHRLQLRRLHDLLPDEPRRPVRGGRRRRRRQRPRQHGRHVRRRATTSASYELGGALGGTPRPVRRDVAARPGRRSVDTPTLVYHGAADVRCPVGQAQQWHTALRERGVPTRLVLYPDASHLFILDGRPSHRIDYNRRVVDWVEQYAGDAAARAGTLDAAHWQRRLAELAERHRVPGAALGILRMRPGRRRRAASRPRRRAEQGDRRRGDHRLGLPDRLDHQGLDRDGRHAARRRGASSTSTRPSSTCCPSCELADADVAESVTMRHLLTHTSGIDGDVFTDTGRGDDCLEKYVALLADAAQNHPLGATWSYCNSGFSLAGRVIEKLTGRTWDAAMRERLVRAARARRTPARCPRRRCCTAPPSATSARRRRARARAGVGPAALGRARPG